MNENTFEYQMTTRLQEAINNICGKLVISSIDIKFKSMEENSKYLKEENLILITKDYLENFYASLELVTAELLKMDLNKNTKVILNTLASAFKSLGKKKLITPDIKEELLSLGFKEVNIGCKEIHEIRSKDLKLDFFSYNIAIGIGARTINYGCKRLYRALVYNFN